MVLFGKSMTDKSLEQKVNNDEIFTKTFFSLQAVFT